jgi:hypothetical protein
MGDRFGRRWPARCMCHDDSPEIGKGRRRDAAARPLEPRLGSGRLGNVPVVVCIADDRFTDLAIVIIV